jgi:hypothetical protein
MTNYTVSNASPHAPSNTLSLHTALDMSCLLNDERGHQCGQPVRFVVDEPGLRFGACADHADLYR